MLKTIRKQIFPCIIYCPQILAAVYELFKNALVSIINDVFKGNDFNFVKILFESFNILIYLFDCGT